MQPAQRSAGKQARKLQACELARRRSQQAGSMQLQAGSMQDDASGVSQEDAGWMHVQSSCSYEENQPCVN